MRSGSFAYLVEARCSPEAAVELLSTFTRHSTLHPLIVGVEELPALPGMLRRFRITDRLKWGPLAFRIRYLAEVLRADLDGVETLARQSPRTTVHNSTRLSSMPASAPDPAAPGRAPLTRAEVTITMTAPRPLFAYAFAQARAAHAELARRMVTALEEAGAGGDSGAGSD